MSRSLRAAFMYSTLLLPLGLVGCASEESAPTPQQIEERRLQQIKQSQSFQKEG
jgi:hypothetical protein